MAKDPAFLFYSQDFIVGTNTMNFEDRGKYITILAQMHQQGRLDEETISFLVGSVSVKLKSKFQIDKNGLWYNERLEEEMGKRAAFVDSRRENGKKGGRPKKPNGKPNGKPSNNLHEDENENEIKDINVPFDDFWNLYDKKKGEKEKLKRKWNKLSDTDRSDIMQYIPKYKREQPNKEFRKNPETFLNNKSWHDEIIEKRDPKLSNGFT